MSVERRSQGWDYRSKESIPQEDCQFKELQFPNKFLKFYVLSKVFYETGRCNPIKI